MERYVFPSRVVLLLGSESHGIPADLIAVWRRSPCAPSTPWQELDACVEIPQLGVIRSLNVHVSGALFLWEFTRQQRV